MPSCERCWTDSALARYMGDTDAYYQLVEQRGPTGCTPEQQAGPDATECPRCRRMTQHQHCQVCMVPGCAPIDGVRSMRGM
jgi:hypothetical protein